MFILIRLLSVIIKKKNNKKRKKKKNEEEEESPGRPMIKNGPTPFRSIMAVIFQSLKKEPTLNIRFEQKVTFVIPLRWAALYK